MLHLSNMGGWDCTSKLDGAFYVSDSRCADNGNQQLPLACPDGVYRTYNNMPDRKRDYCGPFDPYARSMQDRISTKETASQFLTCKKLGPLEEKNCPPTENTAHAYTQCIKEANNVAPRRR